MSQNCPEVVNGFVVGSGFPALPVTVYIRNSNYTNPSNTAGYTHKMSIYSIQSWFYKCSQFKIMVKTNASYSRVSVNLQMSQF
jgi:hypothetical protein